jgi:MFS family permease
MPGILRSIGAIFAGLVAVVALSTLTDTVLESTGVIPPPQRFTEHNNGHLALALAYRTVFNAFGCWLAARLAPSHPMRHALILGVIGMVLGTLGAIVMWSFGAHWYPIALVATALPCAWIGGKLAERRAAHA